MSLHESNKHLMLVSSSQSGVPHSVASYHHLASFINLDINRSHNQKFHILMNEKIVNIYIVYKLGASSSHINDPTLKNCLFGAVTLTKMQTLINMDILVMELDLIEEEISHLQVMDMVKMH